MAIVINGSGTITGVSAGGLPDGSVDSDTLATGIDATKLADGTVTSTELQYINSLSSNAQTQISAAGGKVLQVLNAVKTDTSSINSTTYADISGLSLTITPSATTSKILFTMNVSAGGAADANHIHFNMVRGSTNILVGDTAGSRTSSTNLVNTQGLGQQITATATYLDSPNTTSATTYKIQWKNNGSATNYVNRSTRDANVSDHDGRIASQITLMEIGA